MSKHSHSHETDSLGDKNLIVAVLINVLLTLAQIIGGIISGSLALVADAIHNFSDAASLGIALFARFIGRKEASHYKTFGYKRAEVIATLINLTTLIIIGLYLTYEAIWRLIQPEIIAGWTVVIVAGIALIIDLITAWLTYKMSKSSMNIRAAFLHNVSDALASVGVIIAGTLILLYQLYWVDALITILIAGYILWQGFSMLPKTINILMEGTPPEISQDEIIKSLLNIESVTGIHHLHLWQLDEHRNALEAHIVVPDISLSQIELIKSDCKKLLTEKFHVEHSTLEFEIVGIDCQQTKC